MKDQRKLTQARQFGTAHTRSERRISPILEVRTLQESRFHAPGQMTGKGRNRAFRPLGLRARESVARHCPDEALHFGFVGVLVHAGTDERVQSARGQIEDGRAWRAGHVDGCSSRRPVARLARRFAVNLETDDRALVPDCSR